MRRFLIGFLVAVLVSAVWYFFVVGPINERKEIAQTDLETAQTEEFTLRTTLSRLKKIEENQLEYATAIGQLETAIPSTPRLAELIDDLSFLADENGVALSSLAFSTPNLLQDTEIFGVGVSMSINGQFFEILGFLYGTAELERVMTIESLSLSPSSDEAGFHTMSASLTGTVYTTSDIAASIDLTDLLPPAEETEPPVEDAPLDGGGDATDDTTTTTTAGA